MRLLKNIKLYILHVIFTLDKNSLRTLWSNNTKMSLNVYVLLHKRRPGHQYKTLKCNSNNKTLKISSGFILSDRFVFTKCCSFVVVPITCKD